ncbi:MAG: TrbI/VirB10 family protein [Gemmatimonadota bacterium]|nr:TrbI/VirB10 family protein [Gemmatimonadota bacterium]
MVPSSSRAAVRASIVPSPGPFSIHAGTLIAGILLTAVNSDAPGDILAQVSRDVFDSETEGIVLVPKGSKLLGIYEHQIAIGQNRLVVAWSRLIFPDGRSIALPGLPGKDATGATGLSDEVDNHYRRVFGSAALLSVLGAGLQLSQPQQSNVLAAPTSGQIAAGAAGQELSRVATQLIQRNIDVRPTIRIRQGMPFNVYLTSDLVFDGPYAVRNVDVTAFR